MRVLISRPDKIGDVVLALHGAKQLKRLMPDIELYIYVSPYTRALVENVKFVDGVVELSESLNNYQFDAVIDLMAKRETASLYTNAPIPIKIGNSARWFSYRYNRTRYIRRSKALMNEAEYNWQLISLLSPILKNTCLTDALTASDFKTVTEFDQLTDYIVLMPGVSVSAYGWNAENWSSLALSLAAAGKTVLILLEPAETEIQPRFTELANNTKNIHIQISDTFPGLLGILKNCQAYVGTSTGVTHLASAMGASGLALYPEVRSMHPRRWLPFNTKLDSFSLSRNVKPEVVVDYLLHGQYPVELNTLARQPVSAFVVCYNEEKNIRRCLESIKWCDEIVVVDSGSQDRTLEIVKEYTDQIYFRPWTGHSQQKQFALEKCKYSWVLNIDSDEEVSAELKAQLLRILSQPVDSTSRIKGYNICRVVHFLERWWEHGGWFPEYRMRFFQRQFTYWGGVNPHEKAVVNGRLKKLHEPIYHFTYQNFTHQIETLNKHSSLSAECLYHEGKRCSLHNILLNPLFRFFKFYILKRGFLEGRPGFIVAGIECCYTFFKYIKLWELQKNAISAISCEMVSNHQDNLVDNQNVIEDRAA